MEQQAISSDLIRGHIDTIILHTLIDGDKFAQQISDSIEQKSNGEYKMIQATLYSSLKRLEGLKYVSSYWFDAVDVGGRRKYFKITDLGKDAVEKNLSSWTYSRALIDKLVDLTTEPIYKTEIVEKIVEVEKPVEIVKIQEVSVVKEENSEKDSAYKTVLGDIVSTQTSPAQTEEKVELVQSPVFDKEIIQDINFRNILKGLIKENQPDRSFRKEIVKEPENIEIPQEKPIEKVKLNESITTIDYGHNKINNLGKIDFGDLVLKAAQEGYKIRISSKDSAVSVGKIYSNKLNFESMLLSYIIALIGFLVISLTSADVLQINGTKIAITLSLFTVFPLVSLVFFVLKPKQATNYSVSADTILTAFIVVFNLFLITFAANLIFNIDLKNTFNLLSYLVIPTLIYIDALLFFVFRYFLSKLNFFIVNAKK